MENEFVAITSQEALDNVIKDRLNRQNEKHSKELAEIKSQYADYDELKSARDGYEAKISDLNEQLEKANDTLNGCNSTIAERDAEIKTLKAQAIKERAIRVYELSDDAIEFLSGETEEDIIGCAEKLSKLAPKKVVAPLAGSETAKGDAKTQAYKDMLNNLF